MANLKNGMNSPPSFVPQHDKTRTDNPKPSQTFQVPLGQVAVAGTWKNNNFTKFHQGLPGLPGPTSTPGSQAPMIRGGVALDSGFIIICTSPWEAPTRPIPWEP